GRNERRAHSPFRRQSQFKQVVSSSRIHAGRFQLKIARETCVRLQSHKPTNKPTQHRRGSMTTAQFSRSIGIAAGLYIAAQAAPLDANKQCYAPDARAQERAFSR